MSKIVIPIANQYSYNNMPRNKDLNYNITNYCEHPNKTLLIDWKGDCFICLCEGWLPVTVGNIMDFNSLDEIWNSPTAKLLQDDINEKKFTYCAVNRCGILRKNLIQKSYKISINIDQSCNLRCPSCRNSSIMITEGPEFEYKLKMSRHIINLLSIFNKPIEVTISGNGDCLASNIMRPFLHEFKPKANQFIHLFTNGLLIKKQLENNPITKNITKYVISIDAGSKDVYEKVRLGGKWEILLDNFKFLNKITKSNSYIGVGLLFVLQKENYLDMENFINLCHQYNFHGSINQLENWYTWDDFENQDVIGNKNHPLHQEAMNELYRIYELAKSYKLNNNQNLINFNISVLDQNS